MSKIVILLAGIVVVVWVINRFNRAKESTLRQTGMIPPPGMETEGHVERLAAAGHKIEAIKVYRTIHGTGLKESKEAVEEIMKRMGK